MIIVISNLTQRLPELIDVSCVQKMNTLQDIDGMAAASKKFGFVAAFTSPGMTPYLLEKLKGVESTLVGGIVGFPAGYQLTEHKVLETEQLIKMGCREIDMVMNIGLLKSGCKQQVYQDIFAVTSRAGNIPVKVIIEVTLLSDAEIVTASRIAESAGAAFIKTGTGWCAEPTTVRHIQIIRSCLKNNTKIKAAGGIRTLETILEMHQNGCDRFGLSTRTAVNIMESALLIEP